MNQSNYQEAFTEALKDAKTIEFLAKQTAKKLLEIKSTPSNPEEGLVKNHVIFAPAESLVGKWMISKQVAEHFTHINPELTIRPRVLGKALLQAALETKQTREGKAYFIDAIMENINEEAFENIADAQELARAAEEKAEQVKEPYDLPPPQNGLTEKAKDLNVDFEEVEHLIDKDLLAEAASEYDTAEDYRAAIKHLSRKKLIKYINKCKMPISVEDKSIDDVVAEVVHMVEVNVKFAMEDADEVEPLESLSDFMESIAELGKKARKKAMKQRLKDEAHAEENGIPILPSKNQEAPDVKKSSRGNELVDQSDKDDKDVAEAKKKAKKAKKKAKKAAKDK